jgi:hypothetical protein
MFLKWDDSVLTIVCLHPGDLVVSRSEKKFKRSIYSWMEIWHEQFFKMYLL